MSRILFSLTLDETQECFNHLVSRSITDIIHIIFWMALFFKKIPEKESHFISVRLYWQAVALMSLNRPKFRSDVSIETLKILQFMRYATNVSHQLILQRGGSGSGSGSGSSFNHKMIRLITIRMMHNLINEVASSKRSFDEFTGYNHMQLYIPRPWYGMLNSMYFEILSKAIVIQNPLSYHNNCNPFVIDYLSLIFKLKDVSQKKFSILTDSQNIVLNRIYQHFLHIDCGNPRDWITEMQRLLVDGGFRKSYKYLIFLQNESHISNIFLLFRDPSAQVDDVLWIEGPYYAKRIRPLCISIYTFCIIISIPCHNSGNSFRYCQ